MFSELGATIAVVDVALEDCTAPVPSEFIPSSALLIGAQFEGAEEFQALQMTSAAALIVAGEVYLNGTGPDGLLPVVVDASGELIISPESEISVSFATPPTVDIGGLLPAFASPPAVTVNGTVDVDVVTTVLPPGAATDATVGEAAFSLSQIVLLLQEVMVFDASVPPDNYALEVAGFDGTYARRLATNSSGQLEVVLEGTPTVDIGGLLPAFASTPAVTVGAMLTPAAGGGQAVLEAPTYLYPASESFVATGAGITRDVGSYKSIAVQLSGTFVGTIMLQASNDGVTWYSVVGASSGGNSQAVANLSTPELVTLPASFRYFRVDCTAYTSGTIVVQTFISAAPYTRHAGEVQLAEAYPSPASLPDGAAAANASSGVMANASAAASLAAQAGHTNYLTGFEVTAGGATLASLVTVTVTGILGGTQSFVFAVPAGATVGATPLVVHFDTPLAASASNTAITVTLPACGSGNTAACVNVHGYYV